MSRLSLLAVLFLLLSGCAQWIAMRPDVLRQVQAYEAEQEYGKALDVLAAVARDHPHYAKALQKKGQLESKAKLFEQVTVRRGNELTGLGHWAEAVATYRDALDKLPRSQTLRAELDALRTQQAQHVNELRVDQLVAKARWIERALPVQESIVATDPEDYDSRRELASLRSDAADVAHELTRVGLAALEKNDLGLAGRTLPIASRLSPTPDANRGRNQLIAEETAADQTQRAAQRSALDRLRDQESRRVMAEYQQAQQAGDLRRAHLLMMRLVELDGENPDISRENLRLRQLVKEAVKKYMDEGNSLYGRGMYEQAINSWNKVLDLDQENELAAASLERATRVVSKIKDLREKQAAEPKAAGL